MNLIDELEAHHFSCMKHQERDIARAAAISDIVRICASKYCVYGIPLDLLALTIDHASYFKKNSIMPDTLYLVLSDDPKIFNKNWFGLEMDDCLVEKLSELGTMCSMLDAGEVVKKVSATESANLLFDDFEAKAMAEASEGVGNPSGEIWKHAYMNSLKLAALYAVGNGIHSPVITEHSALKSIGIVNDSILKLKKYLSLSDSASSSIKDRQSNDMHRIIKEYLRTDKSELRRENLIPGSHLMRKLSGCSAFKHDPSGAKEAIHRTISYMCGNGVLSRELECDLVKTAAVYRINKSFFA